METMAQVIERLEAERHGPPPRPYVREVSDRLHDLVNAMRDSLAGLRED